MYKTNCPLALAVSFRYETVYETALLLILSHTIYELPRHLTNTTPPQITSPSPPPTNSTIITTMSVRPTCPEHYTPICYLWVCNCEPDHGAYPPLPSSPFYLLSPKLTLASMQSPQLNRPTQSPRPHGQPLPSSDVDIRGGIGAGCGCGVGVEEEEEEN